LRQKGDLDFFMPNSCGRISRMGVPRLRRAVGMAILCTALSSRALAVDAPYEPRLLRLGEILGSLHYLRNLCGETGSQWRDQMLTLIETEKATGERRAKLIASFNRGYRSFAQTHLTCTSSSTEAIARYMKEGEDLSREIASLFGN
jgi:uncharacterized protein (TIGR02301 family)